MRKAGMLMIGEEGGSLPIRWYGGLYLLHYQCVGRATMSSWVGDAWLHCAEGLRWGEGEGGGRTSS